MTEIKISTSAFKTKEYNSILVSITDTPFILDFRYLPTGKWKIVKLENINGGHVEKGQSIKSNQPLWEQDDRRDTSLKKLFGTMKICTGAKENSEFLSEIVESMSENIKNETCGPDSNDDKLPDTFTYIPGVKYTTFISKMKENLAIDDESVPIVGIATMLTNMIKDGKGVWLEIVGPPSCGKTLLIELLSPTYAPNKLAHAVSILTPNTFLSGMEGNIDLLPRITGKILGIKDLCGILESPDAPAIFNSLREIYDGHYVKETGSGVGTKSWDGRITVIAGATNVIDAHSAVQSNLGERFIKIRVHGELGNVQAEKLRDDAVDIAADVDISMEDPIKEELSNMLISMLLDFEKQTSSFEPKPTHGSNSLLKSCAKVTSTLRTGIKRDFHGNVEMVPEPELGARIVKMYNKLAYSIAWLLGKDSVDFECYSYIYRISLDTVEKRRIMVLRELDWEPQTITEISDKIKLPRNTIKVILEDLWMLGVLNRFQEDGEEPVTDSTGEKTTIKTEPNSKSPWYYSYNTISPTIIDLYTIEILLNNFKDTNKIKHVHYQELGMRNNAPEYMSQDLPPLKFDDINVGK